MDILKETSSSIYLRLLDNLVFESQNIGIAINTEYWMYQSIDSRCIKSIMIHDETNQKVDD